MLPCNGHPKLDWKHQQNWLWFLLSFKFHDLFTLQQSRKQWQLQCSAPSYPSGCGIFMATSRLEKWPLETKANPPTPMCGSELGRALWLVQNFLRLQQEVLRPAKAPGQSQPCNWSMPAYSKSPSGTIVSLSSTWAKMATVIVIFWKDI